MPMLPIPIILEEILGEQKHEKDKEEQAQEYVRMEELELETIQTSLSPYYNSEP